MSDARVMVIRTDRSQKEWIWNEMQAGRLRQGWGITGTQLEENGEPVPSEVWEKRYEQSAKTIWDWAPKPGEALRRYRILRAMRNLNTGDLVVVPRVPSSKEFAIARVSNRYRFDEERGNQDYGHVIPIDTGALKRVPMNASIDTRMIVKKLRGYQRAVNNVWDSQFSKAVVKLVAMETIPSERTVEVMYASDIKNPLIRESLERIRQLPWDDLEKLVKKAFEEAGYTFAGRHRYDRKGGDADLVFQSPLALVSDFNKRDLTIYVQVKQKTGNDLDDIKGVRQLLEISEDDPQCIRILVSTADTFSQECREWADDEGVIRVSGLETAEMLMRYL